MKTLHAQLPFRWPFPPVTRPAASRVSRPPRPADVPAARRDSHTRKDMLIDVVLVLCWGASIPGLMWLGAAGGF